jgi:phasin family protein
MLTPEQIVATNKANLEAAFGFAGKAFEGVQKIVELNVAAAKATLSDASAHAQAVLAVKDVQELVALQAGLVQPLTEKSAAYSRHLYDIAVGSTTEFSKTVEAKAAEAQKAFSGVVDTMTKNAPAGSEGAMALVKSAMSASNNAVESLQKAAKQASSVAESNFNAMTNAALNAAKTASVKK